MSNESGAVNGQSSLIARLVSVCIHRALFVVVLAIVFGAAMTYYVVGNFAMTTDISALLSPKLAWRAQETAFDTAFPSDGSNIIVVIDGQTPELSEEAAARLTERLSAQLDLFHAVQRPDAGPFWAHNRLLFASTEDVRTVTAQLVKAQPFLGPMASDPSIRGLSDTLSLTLQGVNSGQTVLQDLRTPIRTLTDALQGLAADKPSFFSWSALIAEREPDTGELRHIILVDPVLDFTQLEPGKLPIDAIRTAAKSLQLDNAHGVHVRLTGPVPLQDEEFATLAQRAGLIAVLASGAIILMLWLAVRSVWLIASILGTTLVGLVTAPALGLAMFHRFNVISVALIALTRPPGAPDVQTHARLTMIDTYVLGHRRLVLGMGVIVAAISAIVLPLLHFDFNPIHLRSAEVESVATLADLMRDPDQLPNTLEVVRPNLTAADQLAAQFRTNPEVSSARTLSSFIPAGQPEKIALIADAADLLDLTLKPLVVAPPPSDAQVIESLNRAAGNLRRASTDDASLRADAQRLADRFSELAQG